MLVHSRSFVFKTRANCHCLQLHRASTAAKSHSEYLQQSILPSYHFQQCLPKLPVPKLEDTLQRYIRCIEALEGHPQVSRSAIEGTKRAVKTFLQCEGPLLQEKLLQYAKEKSDSSYISSPWFDMYLKSRLPLVLNYNPFLVLNRDTNEAMNDQLLRSTNLIVSSMKFFKTFKKSVLPPDVFYTKENAKAPAIQYLVKYLPNTFNLRYIPMLLNGAYPLDMSQYGNLFSSTRIPRKQKDELKVFPASRHVAIVRNGNFYTMDVLDQDGNILPAQVIYSNLKSIVDENAPRPDHEISYLTSEERDIWAEAREHLVQTGNVSQLTAIDSAIFCLVLEDQTPDLNDVNGMTKLFLYGDGGNRWFDKSFSWIVTENGQAGMNFEHSWGDGVAVVRYVNDVYNDKIGDPALSSAPSEVSLGGNCKKLEFTLDDQAKSFIVNAKQRYTNETSRLKIAAGKLSTMNKSYLKSKKVSPDGILQLSLQVAHSRIFGHPTATYESCSTAAFKHGRTETVRPCTLEAQAVAKVMTQKSVKDLDVSRDLNGLIRESCSKHNSLTYEAAMGQGFDRHMFGLKYMTEIHDLPVSNIFKDPLYTIMNHIVLSTSTLDTKSVDFGGFAAVVSDGFGIGYGAREEYVGVNVTSYESKDAQKFVDAYLESLEDIKYVLENN